MGSGPGVGFHLALRGRAKCARETSTQLSSLRLLVHVLRAEEAGRGRGQAVSVEEALIPQCGFPMQTRGHCNTPGPGGVGGAALPHV